MTLRLNGSTSGYTEIDAPAVAGSNTLVLPGGNGSANQLLKNGATPGSLEWSGATENASGTFTIPPQATQYPNNLVVSESTHAASRRAGVLLGQWLLLQDHAGDGTRTFSVFRDNVYAITANTSGDVIIRGTDYWGGNAALLSVASNINRDKLVIGGYGDFQGFGISFRAGVNSATPARFLNASGTLVGSITQTVSSTAFNTSSDYRLKENVTAVTDGITRLQQLKPSRFNFIADPGQTVDGFIAHEAQKVVPECVTGEKDAVDDDGNPVYQGIDQSKLVPLLTAALQEAITKIEALEARLTALEVTP